MQLPSSADLAPHATHAPRPWARALARLRAFFALAALVIALDQASKALVRHALTPGDTWPAGWTLLHLSHVQNSGAAFGILQGAGEFLIAATLVAIVLVTFFLLTLPLGSRFYPIALSLILGGAIGNLIDRLRFGAVTDFIDPIYYPAFNVADSCIVVGVGVLLVLAWFDGRDAAPAAAPEAPAETIEASR